MPEHPILVLAATGGQGRAVSTALLERGAPLRALVRNPASSGARALAAAGADVVTGSLDSRDSLVAAMRDVTAVFAMTTPFEGGIDEEIAQGRTIAAAAEEADVPHLVFSSVAGADTDSGVPHFQSKAVIEAELAAGSVPHTVLGPTYFYDNALGGADRIRTDGVLDLPLPPDRPLQQLDRRDLGAFAALVLLSPERFADRRIELASDAPTPAAMAAALTDALGSPVRHEQTPLDAVDNPDMHAMWQFLGGPGYQVDVARLHADFPEVPWTPFTDWAADTFGTTAS
ncbi:NmrA/HSCARG family protein [Rhodococcus sp. SGAir0479]|uniref:NmrA/HSCARG family protein n=1 Tax=Rhodococcus sp. SGAir0479 TaxID=2567884 RepID=UPI0010CD57F2|nr:NmrA/HSCARG family protein [Rhodococcus sp. SGAir0479]QCQ92508.1 NmrA/HSCARG family protein [Rhodococcus sp. SGAir0479]